MTVSSQTNSVTYAGDGATTEFAVPYYFLADEHLTVISILVATGEEVVLVLNSEYTVTGEGNPAGGEVTTVVPPAIGRNLEIRRVVPLTQETDYVSNDAFPAESHERALDKLTMVDQQQSTDIATLDDKVNNSNAKTLRVPEGIPAIADAATRANNLLSFDALGNPVAVLPASQSAADLETRLRDTVNPANGATIVPTAVAEGDTTALLRGRTNSNAAFLVDNPSAGAGVDARPLAFAGFFRTGATDLTKIGQSLPPFFYDQAGKEYIEKRAIGIHEVLPISLDDRPKLLTVTPTFPTTQMVALPKRESGYLLVGLVNNVTTTFESLATTVNDTTMRRVASVQSAVSVVVGKKDTYTEGGVWTNQNLGSVLPEIPAFTSQHFYDYKQTTANGATLTFTVTPYNGFVTLSFVCTAASNPAANISVDGVVTTINLTSSPTAIKHFRFATPKQSVPVIITNTSSTIINFLGRDFSTLSQWTGAPVDDWGYYRNSAESDYLVNNSENDYVIREFFSNTYGGGYHGGEASITDTWTVDGVTTAPAATPVVGRKVTLKSTCTIDWTPAGSPVSVAVRKRYDFTAGGYYTEVGLDGTLTCSELYSALFGANEVFSRMDAPTRADLIGGLPNNQRLLVGRTREIQVRNPSTNQSIIANYTVQQNDSATQYGGAFIWRVDGSYKKLYYASAHAGKLAITGNYARNKYEFL